jgi:hypothetical protein
MSISKRCSHNRYRRLTFWTIALTATIGLFGGCTVFRSFKRAFKPDAAASDRLKRAKALQLRHGAKIVWEKSKQAKQYGLMRKYDWVFYDYGKSLSLYRYMRTSGYSTVAAKIITTVTRGGCWYSSSSRGYRYGWASAGNSAVLVRKNVVNVQHTYTNCGEFKDTSAWSAISRVIPARMAADAQTNGSRIVGRRKDTHD